MPPVILVDKQPFYLSFKWAEWISDILIWQSIAYLTELCRIRSNTRFSLFYAVPHLEYHVWLSYAVDSWSALASQYTLSLRKRPNFKIQKRLTGGEQSLPRMRMKMGVCSACGKLWCLTPVIQYLHKPPQKSSALKEGCQRRRWH